jgi:hypothetical protein
MQLRWCDWKLLYVLGWGALLVVSTVMLAVTVVTVIVLVGTTFVISKLRQP